MVQEGGGNASKGDRLGKITNIAILVTLLFLLLNPSGVVGRWVGRQWAEVGERRAVAGLWSELAGPGGALGLGNGGDARPVVVEFLDYQCPACRAVAPVVAEAWDGGIVTIVIRHLPLDQIHPLAREAAKAAVCAEWQGRLREAHDALLGEGGWVTTQDWLGMGEAIDIADLKRFAECLEGEEAEARVDSDLQMAANLGIASTPSFVTDRGIYRGGNGLRAALREVSESLK